MPIKKNEIPSIPKDSEESLRALKLKEPCIDVYHGIVGGHYFKQERVPLRDIERITRLFWGTD